MRARGLAALMYSWRRLPEMPLEEYEQLIWNYINFSQNVPDDSSSMSSYVDSDQASWWEDDPEVQHYGAGLVELLQPDEEPTP